MITIIWNSTGAVCTTFRTENAYLAWLGSRGKDGVTKRIRNHPSVDLRDVSVLKRSLSNDLFEADYGEPLEFLNL